jgi:hypothetical protein
VSDQKASRQSGGRQGCRLSQQPCKTFLAPRKKPSSQTGQTPPELTKSEQDLLTHLETGYRLESGSPGSGPLLRNLTDNTVVRATSANQGTIKALEARGLIHGETKGLTTIWRARKKTEQKKK